MKQIFLAATLFALFPILSFGEEFPNPLKVGTFEDLLNIFIDFIFTIGITVAPIILIIAGFLYITSAGDPKRVDTAKKMILYAVIGLLVLLLARGLVEVLKSVLGVSAPSSPELGPG